MAATVRVNKRTVVHETSEGMSVGFPDLCIVPQVGPIPFLNLALSADSANTSATVYSDGKCVMLKDSYFAKSYGDEPGTDGGIISGTWNGKASFSNYSYDVMIEGRNVARLGDPMVQNHGSPPNVMSPAEYQPNAGGDDATKELLCQIFCYCLAVGGGTECCRQMLSTEWYHHVAGYGGPINVRDPLYPGLYVEVPFDMSQNPPRPMMVKDWDGNPGARSNNPWMKDPDHPGEGMPLPGGDKPPIPGSKRPDVVKVKDPSKPVDYPGNIDSVWDFKFPGDYWRPGQKGAYARIAGNRVFEISEQTCDCPDGGPGEPIPVPWPFKVPEPEKKKEKEKEPKWGWEILAPVAAFMAYLLRLLAQGGGPPLPGPGMLPLGPNQPPVIS